jgi:hypothetical protein
MKFCEYGPWPMAAMISKKINNTLIQISIIERYTSLQKEFLRFTMVDHPLEHHSLVKYYFWLGIGMFASM